MSDGPSSPEQPQPTRAVLREFTKSTPEGRQARSNAAREILDIRTESRQSQQQRRDFLTGNQTSNEYDLGNAEAKKVEAENQLLVLRAQLTDRSSSWLARVRTFISRDFRKETQELQKQLPRLEDRLNMEAGYLKGRQEVYQENLARLERQFTELSQWHHTHPPAGKEALTRFYAEQGQLLKEHQESVEMQRQKAELERYRLEHGTVAEITDKYQGYIVHGITPGLGVLITRCWKVLPVGQIN